MWAGEFLAYLSQNSFSHETIKGSLIILALASKTIDFRASSARSFFLGKRSGRFRLPGMSQPRYAAFFTPSGMSRSLLK
jgi:hypothetical protein